MPRGVYVRQPRMFNRLHRATGHTLPDLQRCSESWWAVPGLTREEFDRKAAQRKEDMRKYGLKYNADLWSV